MSEVVSTAAGMVVAVVMPELPYSRALLVTDVGLRPACGLCVRQQRSKKTVVEWTRLKWNHLSCCFGGQEAALPAVFAHYSFRFRVPDGAPLLGNLIRCLFLFLPCARFLLSSGISLTVLEPAVVAV